LVVKMMLDQFGVESVVVDDGLKAVEALRAGAFDVVLMDMQMPELDGLSATAMLRAREADTGQRRTPVIMLTANAMDEHVRASHEAGADLHLSKPIQAQALIEAILRVMDAAEDAAEAASAAA
jgi:CheY-like chemotaxis protein